MNGMYYDSSFETDLEESYEFQVANEVISGPFAFINSKFTINALTLEDNCGIICGLLLNSSSIITLTNSKVFFYFKINSKLVSKYKLLSDIVWLICNIILKLRTLYIYFYY